MPDAPKDRAALVEVMAIAMRDSEPGMEDKSWRYWSLSAKATLAAFEDVGCVVAPADPTEQQLDAGEAGRKAASRRTGVGGQTIDQAMRYCFRYEHAIYAAMLAASPYRTERLTMPKPSVAHSQSVTSDCESDRRTETVEATNLRLRLQVRVDDLEAALESILSWRPTLFVAADRAPGLVDFLAAMDGAAQVLNARPHRTER